MGDEARGSKVGIDIGIKADRVAAGRRAAHGLRVDMHCDESDAPHSRHIETLAFHTQRLGLQSRVAGSHLTPCTGVPVPFGQDNVMDPWHADGSGGRLEVAHMDCMRRR